MLNDLNNQSLRCNQCLHIRLNSYFYLETVTKNNLEGFRTAFGEIYLIPV